MGFSPTLHSRLGNLSTEGFRNLENPGFDLGEGVNLFVGANGQGKTNLLEAVYLLSTGKSFRGSTAGEMVRFGEERTRVFGDVLLSTGPIRVAIELAAGPPSVRRILVGGKSLPSGGFHSVLPSIAITLPRMEIVRGAPEERRRFVDRGVLLELPALVETMRETAKLLRQKGALLADRREGIRNRQALSGWNEALARASARLRSARRSWIADADERVGLICRELGRPRGEVRLVYRPSPEGGDDEATLLESFEREAPREMTAGRCRVGPGRDEIEILVDGKLARLHASGGEQKTILLALKLAKIEKAEREGIRPLLLLDDLDAELDRVAFERFLGRIPAGLQVLATSAKPEWIEPLLAPSGREIRRFHVAAGRVLPEGGEEGQRRAGAPA